MCVVMVLFWVAVTTAVALAVRYASGSRGVVSGVSDNGSSRPEDVLAQRFAREEIDQDEYRRCIALLYERS